MILFRGEILLLAVPCASGGGEDDFPDTVRPRRLEKDQRAEDVLLRVEHGIGHGLAHADLRRVMVHDLRPERADRLGGGIRSG